MILKLRKKKKKAGCKVGGMKKTLNLPILIFIELLSLCVMFFQLHSGMFMPQIPSNLPDTQALTIFPFPFMVVHSL